MESSTNSFSTMNERRALERFSLEIPIRVEVLQSDTDQVFNLTSTNISAGGVFFHTTESIVEGTPVRLTLSIPNELLRKLTGAQSLIQIQGKVVRSNSTGIAVRFDDKYQIRSMKSP